MLPDNLAHVLRRQAERLGPRVALRYKRHGLYHDLSWARYHAEVRAAAAALIDAGVQPGDRVGVVGENSVDWLIADLAILTAGAVNVCPHAGMTAPQVHYQLHDAGAVWAFVSTATQRDKVRAVRHDLPALRGVVVFDSRAADGDTVAWEAFRQRGRGRLADLAGELDRREATLGPDDLATLMYTSGTTGRPKGVMLTHGNLLSNALACDHRQQCQPGDVILSWLPYTHIYARTVDHYLALVTGTTLALAESAETVVDNLAEVQPTHLAGVPRFYEKVLAAVTCPDAAETGRRLRRVFGGRIDWVSAGGAMLPVPIAEAYHAAGIQLMQGYGLTESSPVVAGNTKTHHKIGTVGRPLPSVEVRIAADGEVLVRGPNVMRGYWNDPQSTGEAIRDGWLHTGDLGALDADGYLTITGRKKELLILSNGKKVVPSYIEGLLVSDPRIDQAVVYGEGRNFLTALLVPNWTHLRAALGGNGLAHATADELAEHPTVHAVLDRCCHDALAALSPAEQVRRFVVLPRPFSVEAEEVTHSLKLRRAVVFARYGHRLDALYHE